MSKHSHIGASSMYRWSQCPGSVRLSRGIPQRSSKYAEEGTLAHELAASLLQQQTQPLTQTATHRNVYYRAGQDNAAQRLGFEEEDFLAIESYVDYVLEIWESVKGSKNSFILIEHEFDLSEVYPGCYGTADCVIYDGRIKKLFVLDYKHGKGLPVSVNRNPQLMYYGLGALISTGVPCQRVELVVAQPRCYHGDGPIRACELDSMELLDFSADLIEFARATEDPNAPLKAGEHCRFCPASPTCPLLKEKALDLAKQEFSPVVEVKQDELSKILNWLPTFESWIKNVREYAYAEALRGRIPEGYKLVQKRATRAWKDEGQTSSFLTLELGMSETDTHEIKLKSPAKIEKLLNKSAKEKLADLIESRSSGTALVEETDKRPAVIGLTPQEQFKVIEKGEGNV